MERLAAAARRRGLAPAQPHWRGDRHPPLLRRPRAEAWLRGEASAGEATHPADIAAQAAIIAINAAGLYCPAIASLTIRKLDDSLKARLRVRAASHGHSMEAEAHDILRRALTRAPVASGNAYESIRACVEATGGFDLEPPPRNEWVGEPPTFD